MGSAISSKQRKSKSKVNAKISASFPGCYGMRSRNSAFPWSHAQTPRESVSFSDDNGTDRYAIRLMNTKLSDEIGTGTESLESYSSGEEELQGKKSLFSRSCYASRTNTDTTFETSETFEPTPLTEVLSQLYLGTEQDAQQVEKLLGLGITHIISIVGGGRYKEFYPKHMYIPLRDNGSSDLLEKLDDSYDFAMESQQPGNKLFIHCQLGQNRSASFVIGFLMKSRNLSLHEAYTFLKEKRELIHPHKKYIEQLRQLDLKLHKVYSTPGSFLDIALCSKEEIKIMHLNFSKLDSAKYKRRQIICFKDEDYSSSSSVLPSKMEAGDAAELFTIYLPDCDDSDDS